MRLEDGEMTGQATSGRLSHSDRAAELGGEPPFGAAGPFPLTLSCCCFLQVDLKHLERRDHVLHLH